MDKKINVIFKIEINPPISKLKKSFKEQASILVPEDFLIQTKSKQHTLNAYAEWFFRKIRKIFQKESLIRLTKWSIYNVDYGLNIGSEINGIRPSIIYKASHYNAGKDTIVIPLTSFKKEISPDQFDIWIQATKTNGLKKHSFARIRQIRCISMKRLGSYCGKIENFHEKNQIQQHLLQMFDIKNPAYFSKRVIRPQ